MAISNEDALSNLVQQKETLMTELASAQRNLLKLEGAIEVLEQLVQENQVQPEVESEPEIYDMGESTESEGV